VRSAISAEDWRAGVLHEERDRELDELLSLISDAAVELAFDQLEQQRRLPVLDPALRQDPERATATISRSLVWTARLLGMQPPPLYVMPDVPTEIASLPTPERTVLVARSLASGREPSELAFLWARQLWYHRPEHFMLIAYPTIGELAAILLAALAAGGRESEAVDDEVRALANALAARLDDARMDELARLADQMQTRGLRRRLIEWTRGVHVASTRAGLVACGDLARAAELALRHPTAAVEPEAQIDDLRAFSISRQYAGVRAQLGIALRG
jgi:hypothetical protein